MGITEPPSSRCGGSLNCYSDDVWGDHEEGERQTLKEHAFESSSVNALVRLPIRMAAIGESLPKGAEAFLPSAKARACRSCDMFDEEEPPAWGEHAQDLAEHALWIRYRAQHVSAYNSIHALTVKRKLLSPPLNERRAHASPFDLSPQIAIHVRIWFDPYPSDV